jgi:hypothetical protein
MALMDLLPYVAAAAGGGGIGAVSQVYLGRLSAVRVSKKDDQDFIRQGFELAVKVVTDQRNDALELLKEQRDRLDQMELEIVGLKLASSFDPFPRWIVDLEGRYVFVNSCFEERFLRTRQPPLNIRDIIGQKHDFIWPPEFCVKINMLDAQARSRPDGRARANLIIEGTQHNVYKFPVRLHGVIVGYAGYITYLD